MLPFVVAFVQGHDVIAVLPNGFGKSLLFHLLPDVLPTRSENNIVVIVCLLNSIIEDQLKVLYGRNVPAAVLQIEQEAGGVTKLFHNSDDGEILYVPQIPVNIKERKQNFLVSQLESLLSQDGRNLMKSDIYQRNV